MQACSAHRLVRLGYRSEAGSEWVSDVEPWAVVIRHGRWYLMCRLPARDAQRAYRIDRVRTAEILDATFTPPADLDPATLLEEHLAVGWEYAAELIIDAPLATVAPCVPRTLGRLDAVDDHTTILTGTTSNPYWYAEQLVALPAAYRIVGGPELRATARELAERMLVAATEP